MQNHANLERQIVLPNFKAHYWRELKAQRTFFFQLLGPSETGNSQYAMPMAPLPHPTLQLEAPSAPAAGEGCDMSIVQTGLLLLGLQSK